MKNKILIFALLIAVITCMLALSVSAAEPDTTKETVTLDDNTECALWDTDGNPLIWYVTENNNGVKSYAYVSATSDAVDYYVDYKYTMFNTTFYTVASIKITVGEAVYNQSTIAVLNMKSDNILVTSGKNSSFVGITVNSMSKLFKNSSNLEYAFLPDSIEDLNSENFAGCSLLKYVNIAELTGLNRISGQDFYNCPKLFANQALDLSNIGLKELGSGAFASTAPVEIILPSTLYKVDSWAFQGCKQVTKITFTGKITTLYSTALFNECTALEEIVGFNFPEGHTSIGEKMFRGCSSLESVGGFIADSVFTSPDGFTTVGAAAFENSSLTMVILSEGLTTLNNCAFKGSKSLTTVILPTTLTALNGGEHFYNTALNELVGLENTKVTVIPYAMFRGLSKWTPDVVKLPNTVTELKQYAFADVGMKSVILGSGFTTFGGAEAFVNCKNLEVVYLPGTITTFGTSTFANKLRSDILFIVTSDDSTYLESIKSNYGCADIVSYADYMNNASIYAKGKHVVSGYNICEAFYYGNHTLDPEKSNACAGICAICKEHKLASNPVHSYLTAIAYTNYLNSGVKTEKCQNEGCIHYVTPNETDVDAIIKEFKGISVKEKGNGLTFGYVINYDALDEYVAVNGNDIELGFVVAVQAFLEGNQPLTEGGEKSSDKVMKLAIYNSATYEEGDVKYMGADFVLNGNWNKTVDLDGDGTNETDIKDVAFYMAGYIMDGGELSYINSDASGKEAGTAYYNQYK